MKKIVCVWVVFVLALGCCGFSDEPTEQEKSEAMSRFDPSDVIENEELFKTTEYLEDKPNIIVQGRELRLGYWEQNIDYYGHEATLIYFFNKENREIQFTSYTFDTDDFIDAKEAFEAIVEDVSKVYGDDYVQKLINFEETLTESSFHDPIESGGIDWNEIERLFDLEYKDLHVTVFGDKVGIGGFYYMSTWLNEPVIIQVAINMAKLKDSVENYVGVYFYDPGVDPKYYS